MTDSESTMTNEWDGSEYDATCEFVHDAASDLVDVLDPQSGERVLDLGCGTGHLTEAIRERGATAVGIDSAESMIAEAREQYPDCEFGHADARHYESDDSFDAVFSNAALHWIPEVDQDALLDTVADALEPGGRFVAECGGVGNVAAIRAAVGDALADRGYDSDNPWYFPSIGEYASRLEAHEFEVRMAELFDRPTTLDGGDDGLRGWLDMFGDPVFGPLSEAEQDAVVSEVEDALREELFRDGSWVADYRRLRFVAVKP
ncbi:methyltransferase domain-containing protein [Halonotius roseus]|uniref:Methyltransferase domain-containing protein n=1 Tax=Halonotius roseus TaxID=2511997 RepID=A0A544QKW7_9EURY|nr:methyltransferase domain-containing protein [Halonotius roseus]TQQ79014.1 methyltransferase domain-containing protein [Halonotius roseus]